mgnify:CR=1 FL=1
MNLLELYQTKYTDAVRIYHNKTLDLYSVTYLHGGVNFADPYIAMARGLVLDKDGNIILRGFSKFFNYLQLHAEHYKKQYTDEWVNEHDNFLSTNKDKKYHAIEKLDGSLVLMGEYKNKAILSSTSTTNQETELLSIAYENLVNKNKNLTERILNYCKKTGQTLIFLYIFPANRIVVEYENTDYVLIGIVDNYTGTYMSQDDLDSIAMEFGFTRPKRYIKTLQELTTDQKILKNHEGYIVFNEYGNLIKFKTDDWFSGSDQSDLFFGTTITSRKVLIILDAYIDDKIDDLYARQNQNKELADSDVIGKVIKSINYIENLIQNVIDNDDNWMDGRYVFATYDKKIASCLMRLKMNNTLFSKRSDCKSSAANTMLLNLLNLT